MFLESSSLSEDVPVRGDRDCPGPAIPEDGTDPSTRLGCVAVSAGRQRRVKGARGDGQGAVMGHARWAAVVFSPAGPDTFTPARTPASTINSTPATTG